MENGIGENENSHGSLNKYACSSVMAASIISAVFGYGEWVVLISFGYGKRKDIKKEYGYKKNGGIKSRF